MLSQLIVGVRLGVENVNRCSLEEHTSNSAVPPRSIRGAFHEVAELHRSAVGRLHPEEIVAYRTRHSGEIGLTQSSRRRNQRVQDGMKIEGRAADDLEHVGCRGLLLQRFAQFVK